MSYWYPALRVFLWYHLVLRRTFSNDRVIEHLNTDQIVIGACLQLYLPELTSKQESNQIIFSKCLFLRVQDCKPLGLDTLKRGSTILCSVTALQLELPPEGKDECMVCVEIGCT
jgi:hypothetical protein